jgi:hypothetical protein
VDRHRHMGRDRRFHLHRAIVDASTRESRSSDRSAVTVAPVGKRESESRDRFAITIRSPLGVSSQHGRDPERQHHHRGNKPRGTAPAVPTQPAVWAGSRPAASRDRGGIPWSDAVPPHVRCLAALLTSRSRSGSTLIEHRPPDADGSVTGQTDPGRSPDGRALGASADSRRRPHPVRRLARPTSRVPHRSRLPAWPPGRPPGPPRGGPAPT